MKASTTSRLLWFALIYAASVAVILAVAEVLKLIVPRAAG